MLISLHVDRWNEVIERKIKYDQKVVEHTCQLLDAQGQKMVLFHKIEETFTMSADDDTLTIPKGSYTTAYYWKDRPYNMYFWRDDQGEELGSYFNMVGHTWFNGQLVMFEDLIVDLLVLPNGDFFVLDEDELPESLADFEQGSVRRALEAVMASLESILDQVRADADGKYHHSLFVPLLK
ncbi:MULTISPECIES: DUF402 domain-containing protein [Bacillus]|uniref:DUF402 domain-containing protein n=1 Tax=Bacillus TaxID=1386 RepID=UPI0016431BA5|nr:DUF402 domain-containing protein [Bacillus pumilus]